ncbi:hypothetical protein FQA39_LY10344 [Lamprigera yunnana]|nr:hypothetical protein FQA39_LY10344 [Lamprigera yunnana]
MEDKNKLVAEISAPVVEIDLRHIRITICGYKNIVKKTQTFLVSDLSVEAEHFGTNLGLSSKTTITDDSQYCTSFDFVIECDLLSAESINTLISYPVTFKVFENPAEADPSLVAQLEKPLEPLLQETIIRSAESAVNLIDVFTEKPNIDKASFPPVKTEKASTKSSKKVKDFIVTSSPSEPLLVGTAHLDLIPLFLGNKCFTESLLIYNKDKVFDDQLVPAKIMPCLNVEVMIDEDNWLSPLNTNILSISVESIYNVPTAMTSEMTYDLATYLPNVFGEFGYTYITGGKHTEEININKMKQWPVTSYTDYNINQDTKYRFEDSTDGVQNNLEVNLEEIVNSTFPRVEFNCIIRKYLSREATVELHKVLKKYRRIPLEIYMSSTRTGEAKVSKKEEKRVLHLMSEVYVPTLLYPGVSKVRLACPLRSFNAKELNSQTGMPGSYFISKFMSKPSSPSTKGKSKADKTSKANASTQSNKSETKSVVTTVITAEEEPSSLVYNANNEVCFILLQFELLKPLEEKVTIEDLTQRFLELLPPRPTLNKHIMSEQLSEKYFTEVLKKLLEDLLTQHDYYLKNGFNCTCAEFKDTDVPSNFLIFLQKSGMYVTYITSLTRAITTLVSEKHPYVGNRDTNSKEYQTFIASVYSNLVKQVNAIINETYKSGVEIKSTPKSLSHEEALHFYAKEACELGATLLADRYFLERISQNDCEPKYWFDYAIFQLQIGDTDKAFECVKQSLLIDEKHKYSLALFGILLSEKKLNEEAETCFLLALFLNPKWVEGWGTLYLFYTSVGNGEGADLCKEMANKYIKYYDLEPDYLSTTEDLVWTTEYCPKTVFFRTSIFLIKLRALQYAERALTISQKDNDGLYHYYLAVIMYYYNDPDHCLIHIEEAEKLHGLDYAIGSLKGHCYLALTKYHLAQAEYMRVLEMFNKPDDLHLLYVYLALIYERLDNKQFSRKLLLLACKYSPTPYTWLATGLLYYGQKDLISAEQCLMQANLCDNRLPEVWGYLVLINLEMNRYNEAKMCYKQTKKNKIENVELLSKIEEAWKCVEKNN